MRRASRSSALLSLLAALVLLVVPITGPRQAAAASCGVWRWDVKTLSDPDRRGVDFDAQRARIDHLRKLDPPSSLSTDTPRLDGIEKQVLSVRAQVITATIEDDSDIHLVIATRGERRHTMIVEFPLAACVAKQFKRTQMTRARNAMLAACGPISSSSFTDLNGKVRISGVGFWDEIHGQTGVAPNGIELHPVLSFAGPCSQR